MSTRHQSREIAFQFLYRMNGEAEGQAQASRGQGEGSLRGARLLREIDAHFAHFGVPEGAREFAARLIAIAVQNEAALDETIEKHASHWKVSRMGWVDKSLLRLAVAELQHEPGTAAAVVIDEAVELAKQFGTEDTPAFINGILDSVRRALGREAR